VEDFAIFVDVAPRQWYVKLAWQFRPSKNCIMLTLALTSPPLLLPHLTLSRTRSSPSLTYASPPNQLSWASVCWRVST
jgi:hypothetical protein